MKQLPTFQPFSLLAAGARAAVALLFALFFAANAYADRTFAVRYSVNTNGELKLIGNALLHCPATSPSAGSGDPLCDTARSGGAGDDNNFAMAFVDIDSDPTTFNSSSATLSMPAGSTVLFAGLYWGAKSTNAARNQALFSTPGAFGYTPVTASVLDTSTNNQYQGFANVTGGNEAISQAS